MEYAAFLAALVVGVLIGMYVMPRKLVRDGGPVSSRRLKREEWYRTCGEVFREQYLLVSLVESDEAEPEPLLVRFTLEQINQLQQLSKVQGSVFFRILKKNGKLVIEGDVYEKFFTPTPKLRASRL